MLRVRVTNARTGGRWWRVPVLLVIWVTIAAPIVVFYVGATTLRKWARDLPEVPDLAAWSASAPQTSRCWQRMGLAIPDRGHPRPWVILEGFASGVAPATLSAPRSGSPQVP